MTKFNINVCLCKIFSIMTLIFWNKILFLNVLTVFYFKRCLLHTKESADNQDTKDIKIK